MPALPVTDVRIKLVDHDERLRAFCCLTIGGLVVRDLKVVDGPRHMFVAMPSRRLTDRCPSCRGKTVLTAAFCEHCGHGLDAARATRGVEGRAQLWADVVHPISRDARQDLEKVVLAAYAAEVEAAKKPGYVCRYDDYES